MMRRFAACALAGATLLFAACTADSEFGGTIAPNQAPQVWLSAAPPEGSTSTYTIHLFWGGWDPDGEISHYEYLVTENTTGVFDPADTTGVDWHPVMANDSTFTFSADLLSEPNSTQQASEFKRSHTFFIRAVDREGLRSAEPAYRSFTARTLSPSVSVKVPVRNAFNPAELPPITTFQWVATDYVDDLISTQEPESVQVALVSTTPFASDYARTLAYLRTPAAAHEWKPWIYYRARDGSGKQWTTPPTEFGGYIFAVRAKDEAGAVTPVLDEAQNVRRVRVSRRTTGPYFKLKNLYLGQIVTTSCSTPLAIIDLPAGVPIDFTLLARADFYGGTVSGYRYGWDITDLNDPEKWEVDLTPFVGSQASTPSRTFFFGTHTFTAEVIDNSGFCSRIEVKVNIVQFTLERNLLIVDDFRADQNAQAGFENAQGRGSLPSDAEHDAFWLDMASGVDAFDPVRDVISTALDGTVPLTVLASYKSIVWSVYGDVAQRNDLPQLYQFIKFRPKDADDASSSGKITPNLLALTMAAGGHIMIAGQHPAQNVINRAETGGLRFPLIPLYELKGKQDGAPDVANPVGDQSFAYKELCLETLDYANTTNQKRRNQTLYCSIIFVRQPDANSRRDDTMREAIPLNPAFPTLTLRPEVSATGKFYHASEQGLDSEVYNAPYFAALCRYVPSTPRICFEPIYGLGCFDTNEPTYRAPVAFFTSAFADRVADVPGAVGARSVVWGFPPVFFKPDEVRGAMEVIFFDEWQLPRR